MSLVGLALFYACVRPAPEDTGAPPEPETDADIDTDADSDADTDTDTDSDTDTDTDTAPEVDWLTGVVECPPTEGYSGAPVPDHRARRYCLAEEHVSDYLDNDGEPPAFWVVWFDGAEVPPEGQPALVYLHGGVVGNDDLKPDSIACNAYVKDDESGWEGIRNLVAGAVYGNDTLLDLARREGWLMLVPESLWCDLWGGLGPDDPVDTNHKSLLHVETMLDVMSAGLDGFHVDDDRLYLWGTSVGAAGTWSVGRGWPVDGHRFAGQVSDSGPMSTVAWYVPYSTDPTEYPSYQSALNHILGGSPYERDGVTPAAAWDNYTRFDARLLIEEQGFRVPTFQLWNGFDTSVEPYHGPDAAAALADTYDAEGVRYFARDLDHHAPLGADATYHVQTLAHGIPWVQTAMAGFDFLAGAEVWLVEAEDQCETGTCTIAHEDDPEFCFDPTDEYVCYAPRNLVASLASGTAAVRWASEGPGVVFRGSLPASLPRGVPATLRPVLKMAGVSAPDGTTALTLTYTDERGDVLDTVEVPAEHFTRSEAAASATELVDWVVGQSHDTDFDGDGTREGLPEGTVTLTVETTVTGDAYFDGLWFTTR